LHQKPLIRQVVACKPWVEAEIQIIHPKVVVCLGATAAQSMMGRIVRITQERGKFLDGDSGAAVFITIHPSSIYRLREKDEQEKEFRRFVAEMKTVQRRLRSIARA
jgi:uracil-DNA glycosylase